MTRKGKIARLPRHIRDHLNSRLEDGEEGTGLVAWLNRVPEVNLVRKEAFDGRPWKRSDQIRPNQTKSNQKHFFPPHQ